MGAFMPGNPGPRAKACMGRLGQGPTGKEGLGDTCSCSPLPLSVPQMWMSVRGMPTFAKKDSAV